MILEQPAELNKYETSSSEKFGGGQIYRILFPALFLPWVISSELVLIRPLLGEANAVGPLAAVLVFAVLFFALIPAIIAWQVKFSRRFKKTLLIDDKGLKKPANNIAYLPWKKITAWQLEPIENVKEFQRLRLEYRLRGSKRCKHWAIVLKVPEQTFALRSQAMQIRQSGAPVPDLTELSTVPTAKLPAGRAELWLTILSAFFLPHALLFVSIGIGLFAHQPSQPPDSTHSAHDDSPLTRLLVRHFSSPEQLRNFLMTTGVCLTLLTITLFICARILRAANPGTEESIQRS